MSRQYTHIQVLTKEIFERKQAGQTNRMIAAAYGLTPKQVENLITRENRREKRILAGYTPLPKGRPRKNLLTEDAIRKNEIIRLRMQVELLRNFLLEVGRR